MGARQFVARHPLTPDAAVFDVLFATSLRIEASRIRRIGLTQVARFRQNRPTSLAPSVMTNVSS